MRKNIINVFGRWIDVSRILSITEPKLVKSNTWRVYISFDIYAEMLDKPIEVGQALCEIGDIWTGSPSSLFIGTSIISQCPEFLCDSCQILLTAEVLTQVINKIGDTEKVLRNLKSLQKFWQDYELLLQKWKELER